MGTKGYEVHVKTFMESEVVQDYFMKKGYRWAQYGQEAVNLDQDYLFFNEKECLISCADKKWEFIESEFKELTVEEIRVTFKEHKIDKPKAISKKEIIELMHNGMLKAFNYWDTYESLDTKELSTQIFETFIKERNK